jgi:PAS domain S-box-containing protein
MSFSLAQILLFIVAYLTALFTVAHVADKGLIPERITRHPATYVLSLGIFAGAMASNGVLDLAQRYGYGFLSYYLGAVLVFALAGLLLFPLLRLCRVYQLASLADVLTFRFRSPWVGAGITVAMCLTLLPLLALQIQAVADSVQILSGGGGSGDAIVGRHNGLAQLFCIIITVFSILFGTRHLSSQERNTGLVTAMAFESLVKLGAMLTLMLVCIYQVFGGFGDMQQWLSSAIARYDLQTHQSHSEAGRSLLLLFLAGAVCMPHIFHMTFAEQPDSRDLRAASWGLPLYLLLLSLPVLPLLWAGLRLGHGLPVDYSGIGLGLALESGGIATTAFAAGLSAASATIIVTTLALANMCLNHLVLPSGILSIDREQSIYIQLKWLRRSLIALLILAGYSLFVALDDSQSLTELALLAFSGTLQFLPGVIATPFWPRANRKGLLAGLGAGLALWLIYFMLPTLGNYPAQLPQMLLQMVPGFSGEHWSAVAILSLGVNTGIFVVVSLVTRRGEDERAAAEICSMDVYNRPTRQGLDLHSAGELSERLAPALGEKNARIEVERALAELQFHTQESRPYALRRVRARLEANLSGLLGPAMAHDIIERCVPFRPGLQPRAGDLNLIERNLDRARNQFTGMAADLDNLRRHYRETLDKLPIGVCSLSPDGELLMWNRSMAQITGIVPGEVLGSLLSSLPEPWCGVIGDFQRGSEDTVLKTEVAVDPESRRWFSLHRAATGDGGDGADTVILVEDVTELERLEEELLHSERLATIGRLAAGVAHEIGNPVTGIACLAQNLEYESDPGEIRHMARDILKQTGRVSRIVESLVNFSHTGSTAGDSRLVPANLADCVDEAISLLELDRDARLVVFQNDCDRELVALADPQRLLQVFINLLSNARDASPESGVIRIDARAETDRIEVEVEDQGHGIPAEIQSQVFEPFYTTKEPGEGTGLGLALVFSIMEDMGGGVQISSPADPARERGTRVTLQLARTSYSETQQV